KDRRQHGLRHEAAPHLLHDDHQVAVAEPEAAVLLGQDDARPAEPGHLAPERAREAVRVGRVTQRPDALQGRAPRDELARRVLEELLLFREDQVHQSGSPSTRLAMMSSWTSEVPPSIELPRERSQSRVILSSSSAKPGPSQPSACGPRSATRRLASSRSLKASAIMVRSWPRRAFARSQPPFTRPTTLRTGTRTSARNVSQKGEEPLISLIGRTVTPGVSMSMSRKVMPACLGASRSVRTRRNIQSALSANEVHTFCP